MSSNHSNQDNKHGQERATCRIHLPQQEQQQQQQQQQTDSMESVNTIAATAGSENNALHVPLTDTGRKQQENAAYEFLSLGNRRMAICVAVFLVTVGGGVSACFLTLGTRASRAEQDANFRRQTLLILEQLRGMIESSQVSTLLVQETSLREMTTTFNQNNSSYSSSTDMRNEFALLYDGLLENGILFESISFHPNVSKSLRPIVEMQTKLYLEQSYPGTQLEEDYSGFLGWECNATTPGSCIYPRSSQPFYFPSHLLEPFPDKSNSSSPFSMLGFDFYSLPSIQPTIDQIMTTWQPAMSRRIGQDFFSNSSSLKRRSHPFYHVLLLHPGLHHSSEKTSTTLRSTKPTSFSALMLSITEILEYIGQIQFLATKNPNALIIALYDTTLIQQGDTEEFLGGIFVPAVPRSVDKASAPVKSFQRLSEQSYQTLKDNYSTGRFESYPINIVGNRTWTIVLADDITGMQSSDVYVILAGALMFMLCAALGLFVYCNLNRMNKMNALKNQAQEERAMLIVESAQQAARIERELNDFIAHEVRNPLAAAMSACSFVSAAIQQEPTVHEYKDCNPIDETKQLINGTTIPNDGVPIPRHKATILDDIGIIECSLHFINDLLRNMLDVQRASFKQLHIEVAPTHILQDVLQPVHSMLHVRGCNFSVLVDCQPSGLVILGDSLRLKQIILNLARNAAKYVDHGFIRLRAAVVNGTVQLSVEDSGPGIPEHKLKQIFGRFQESLDSLNQGAGIGLYVCKKLTEIMQGDLWVDTSYDSGIPGHPGARFVVDLKVPPMELDDKLLDEFSSMKLQSETRGIDLRFTMTEISEATKPSENKVDEEAPTADHPQELPKELNVLFVDDDLILRKLFSRSVKKVAPEWNVQEAANGESALKLVETESFDLIFMDQYMASVQKQLLGTETVQALRAKGVQAKICGLSANDVERAFMDAGADSFLFKPFPCQKEALERELIRILANPRLKPIEESNTSVPFGNEPVTTAAS